LVLPQDPDDLLFRESRSFHSVRPFKGRTLAPRGGNSQGHVSIEKISNEVLNFQADECLFDIIEF
ncbi:hypothetical protein, partial [Brevundimonas diminuta]|uniref:hypothetical protein n=1 Tax=Brevundimonas diminuta TaxID=293 RepID=UPI001C531C26